MNNLAQAVSISEPRRESVWKKLAGWRTAILLILIAWLYAPIAGRLVHQWWTDPNFSHGFFVPAFSAYVVWQDRVRLAALRRTPSMWGLPIILLSVFLLLLGVFGAELFLSRISLVILIAGMVIFFLGWEMLGGLLFPLLFLILMVPIPAIVFNQITFPLQILASKLAAWSLPFCGVPVLREGNVINLPAMPLEVADACSGIRSLLSVLSRVFGMADFCGFVAHAVWAPSVFESSLGQTYREGARMSSQWRFLIAVVVLGSTGLLLHARNSGEIIPARQPLSSFPHDINGWTSADFEISKSVLEVLGPGDFLLRGYQNSATNSYVDLFIAYFPSQRSGDTIHSPKNCLPGSGWTPIQSDRITVRHRSDGSLIRVTTPLARGESVDSAQQRVLSFAGNIVALVNSYVPR